MQLEAIAESLGHRATAVAAPLRDTWNNGLSALQAHMAPLLATAPPRPLRFSVESLHACPTGPEQCAGASHRYISPFSPPYKSAGARAVGETNRVHATVTGQSGGKPGSGAAARSAPPPASRNELPAEIQSNVPATLPTEPDGYWAALRRATVDAQGRHDEMLLAGRHDRSQAAFDVLRTRLLQALKARGWTRVAITSPTSGCGKTFVTANLAMSLARISSCRTVVMDMDLRNPGLGAALGLRDRVEMREYLLGHRGLLTHLRRLGPNLAVGLNDAPIPDAAEVLQEPGTADTLRQMRLALAPDVVLYDMPSALGSDDVSAFLPQLDAVLLVIDGRQTRARDIAECERLFAGQAQLLGIVLNKSDDRPDRRYQPRLR